MKCLLGISAVLLAVALSLPQDNGSGGSKERHGTYLGITSRDLVEARAQAIVENREVRDTSPTIVISLTEDIVSVTSSTTTVSIYIQVSQPIRPSDGIGFLCSQFPDELLDFIPLTFEQSFAEDTVVTIENRHEITLQTTFHHLRECDLELKYLASDFTASHPHPLLRSGVPGPIDRDPATPYHLRIAFGPQPQSQMWLSWTADSNASRPFVWVGTESGNYSMRFLAAPLKGGEGGFWDSYYPKDMCGAPANRTGPLHYLFPGYFANVLALGLEPSTLYYAVVGSDEQHLSDETTFTTGRTAAADAPVRIAAFGDMALSIKGAISTVHHIVQLHKEVRGIDAVLHFGDLGYAMGSTLIWDLWHTYIESVSRQIPYLVAPGNHEIDHASMVCYQDPSGDNGADGTGFHPTWGIWGDDSQGEGGAPIFHRFKSPACVEGGGSGLGLGNSIYWYSLSLGSVHIVQISSEQDFTPGSTQYAWLAQDLASVDRSVTPWLVVTMHRPMFSPEAGAPWEEGQGILANVEPLFLQWGVDMVLGGHAHTYERMCPMKNMKCVPSAEGGITYITVGSAGATVHNSTMVPGYEEWLVDWRVEWGFGIISAANRTALHWEFFSNTDGAVKDEVWIRK